MYNYVNKYNQCARKDGLYVEACSDMCNGYSITYGPNEKDLRAGRYRLRLSGITSNFTSPEGKENYTAAFESWVVKWNPAKVYSKKVFSFADMQDSEDFFHDFEYDGKATFDDKGTEKGIEFFLFIKLGCFRAYSVALNELN